GTDHDLALDQRWVVTWPMPDRNRRWQLGDGLIDDQHMVTRIVGSGVARTEHSRECFTGAVGEAQQWMKSEASLVRAGLLLVLRMDLDERGVDVQVDRPLPLGDRRSTPHFPANLSEATGDRGSHLGGDLVEGPVHRRVR